MNKYYNITRINNRINVELSVPKDEIEPGDLASIESLFSGLEGCEICLGGRCPAEVYAALAYHARKINASRIIYRDSQNLEHVLYDATGGASGAPAKWYYEQTKRNFHFLKMTASPHEGGKWRDSEVYGSNVSFGYCSGDVIVLSGKGGVHMYALLAIAAAEANCDILLIDKPQYSRYISIGWRDCGNSFPKTENKQAGTIVGVLGDPNSGKSVFSKTLSKAFSCINVPLDVWLYDCDFASPTSDWYFDVTSSGNAESLNTATEARQRIKRKWTPEMQRRVAQNLAVLRYSLDITLADMPGGRKTDDGILHRIPDENRAEMMKQCDCFIVIGNASIPDVFAKWRAALAEYGLDNRIIAEFISYDPEKDFTINNISKDDQGVFHASFYGLDRSIDLPRAAHIMAERLPLFIKRLRYGALAAEAKSATTKAFLTKEGGTRYGAAVLTSKGNYFSTGQYSSFNHSTNIHAEMGAVSMAASASEPDVIALALASTAKDTARPCGVCRQVLWEHALRINRDFDVVMIHPNGNYDICPVSQLLPYAWESHNSVSIGHCCQNRNGEPQVQPRDNAALRIGDHVQFQNRDDGKSFLAMVWDPCLFTQKSILKIKYYSPQKGQWVKTPHSFTESASYLSFLYDNGLSAKTKAIESVCYLHETRQIEKYSPMPVIESNDATGRFLELLSQAEISREDVLQTGSRCHGLSTPGSDYDLMIQVTPEQIQAFRLLFQDRFGREDVGFPTGSRSVAALARVCPDGLVGMVKQLRFLETIAVDGSSFSCIFTPKSSLEPAIPDGYLFDGRTAVSGRIENADRAAYKRSETILDCEGCRRIRLLSYYKTANMLKAGDVIAAQGYLYQHGPLDGAFSDIRYTLVQVAPSTDSLVWLR